MIRISQHINFDCDVLIVGGGPAGSTLAHHLASANIRTIVVDAAEFPRDKICGDGVSPVALRELHRIGVTQTDTFEKANAIDKVGLFLEDDHANIQLEKPEDLPFHARIIPRIELDYMIYKAARKAGAIFHEKCRVTDYKMSSNRVVTTYKKGKDTRHITSKLIVGADGSRSLVGRRLRGCMPDPEYQLLGLRAYYENIRGPKDRVDVYFSKENFPGIFWLFPKGETGANVGMAMIYKTCPEQASEVRQRFAAHVASNPVLQERLGNGKAIEKIQGWPITFYDARNPVTTDRLMLVGEAAGLINPLSGDGIQYAVLSARWAAENIIAAAKQGDFSAAALYGYEEKLKNELAFDFSLSNLMVQFGRNKTLNPLWMTTLRILINRCRDDPKFAATIAGIFEGTYPSYRALEPEFLLKILLQASMSANSYLINSLEQPDQLLRDGTQLVLNSGLLIKELAKNPAAHLSWLTDVAGKTFNVVRHTIHKNGV
ncbi:MAG: geranylgeranyl reductase family protein [Bacteroidota bacterium]